jgi:CofD-related protein of GAK system
VYEAVGRADFAAAGDLCRALLSRRSSRPPRLERSDPERGPRILFFSGGSALREISRALVPWTCNSLHVITPFDSGGSSAELRKCFGMPSVGDLRNRILALADLDSPVCAGLVEILGHRLPVEATPYALDAELDAIVRATHPLCSGLEDESRPLRELLRIFRDASVGNSFDLRNASIGNLVLTTVYMTEGRQLRPAIDFLTGIVGARGTVVPSSESEGDLVAELEDGREVEGQHRITGKEAAPLSSRIRRLRLAGDTGIEISPDARAAIASAEVICFPIGSFFTSVVANLLPRGVTEAIRESPAPRIYVPNTGMDPEEVGWTIADRARLLGELIGAPIHTTLLDERQDLYAQPVDVGALEEAGIRVRSVPLTREGGKIDPLRLLPHLERVRE